jgi:hypothetical protein
MLESHAEVDISETWMAVILAGVCMGRARLWHDLGL